MPRLMLLNGAPGSGQSTLARLYVAEHPMTLALDVDTVRGMVGGWLDRPLEAGPGRGCERSRLLASPAVRPV